MEEILLRLHQSIDYLKDIGKIHKQQDIADAMGMGKARVSEALKGKEGKFTDHFINSYWETYKDYINKDWLLTGEGRMEVADKSLRPHYDSKASAGFMDGINEGKMSAEFRPMLNYISNYDFSIDVSGDSMLPRIEDGDTLMCRKSIDRLNPPIGKTCVLDTKEGVVVKIIKNVTDNAVVLHSLNVDYRDYAVEFDNINGIAEVVGSFRRFV